MLNRTVARLTRRQRAQRALAAIARSPARERLQRLQRLRRRDFEACVCELERSAGARVTRARRRDGTRGLYLIVRADGARVVLSCKHWPHARAGTNELRCLLEHMRAAHAGTGALITCGELSETLLGLEAPTVELVDGATLLARIEHCLSTAR